MISSQFSLNQVQKNQVIEQTKAYIDMANRLLNLNLMSINVRFDLRGKSSGMFVARQGEIYIRYNEIIFSTYYDDSLINTVAHEVAHYVVYAKAPRRRVKPHGKEWKSVMALFGVAPEVTSKYDISALPLRQQQRHEYRCACMIHQLTTTRHNKINNKKVIYHCKKCMQPLKFRC